MTRKTTIAAALMLAAGIAAATGAHAMTTEGRSRDDGLPRTEDAVLGGGCFWCLEAVFEEMKGVLRVESGYAGGDDSEEPDYKEVCAGTTGHAEVVRIVFEPDVVSFGELLDVFFNIHDPTTLNRQGADIGTQYRSVILTRDDAQRAAAEAAIARHGEHWSAPIVTEVTPLTVFHRAEEYHQDYFRKNPAQGYCQAVVAPKVDKARKAFPEKLK